MFTLFGNGISDDTLAIQEMLDNGASEVVLPAPAKCYLISKTLKIHANQTLRMAPTTHIRLADGSNCCMIENDDFGVWAENVCIDGLTVKNVYRDEDANAVSLISVDKEATVQRLSIDNVAQKNRLDGEFPFIVIDGKVEDYTLGFTKEYKM